MPFSLIAPDGRQVTVEKPALAVRLRAQGYRDADPEPELSATEPLHDEPVVTEHVFVELHDSATAHDDF
jgi:hypothetical protein